MDLYFIEDAHDHSKPFDKLGQCGADYTNQCSTRMPYICTRGLVKGACTDNPNVWQKSRMCQRFCDVRNKPNVQLIQPYPLYRGLRKPQTKPENDLSTTDRSKKIICPSNIIICGNGEPYLCLAGIQTGGCGENAQYWQNSHRCTNYCDTSKKFIEMNSSK